MSCYWTLNTVPNSHSNCCLLLKSQAHHQLIRWWVHSDTRRWDDWALPSVLVCIMIISSPRWTSTRWVLIDSSQSGGDNMTNSSHFPLKHHFAPLVKPLSQRVSEASWKRSSGDQWDQWASGSNDTVATVLMTQCRGSRKWLWQVLVGTVEQSSLYDW